MSNLNSKHNCMGVREVVEGPTYLPCGGKYYQTDCMFFSDGTLDGSMDLGANPSMSEFVKCLLHRISVIELDLEKKESKIDELEKKINKLM